MKTAMEERSRTKMSDDGKKSWVLPVVIGVSAFALILAAVICTSIIVKSVNSVKESDNTNDTAGQAVETAKQGDIDVATKVRIRKMATDTSISPVDAIVKTKEVDSLYTALDFACAWLKVS